MDPVRLRRLVRKWIPVVAPLTLVAAVTAYVVSDTLTPTYQSQGTLLVAAPPQSQGSALNLSTTQVTTTYVVLITAKPMLERVIGELKLHESAGDLAARIKATPEQESEIIRVAVNDPSPQRAAEITNTLMTDFVADLSKQNQARVAQASSALVAQIDDVRRDETDLRAKLADATKNKQDTTALNDRLQVDSALLAQLSTSFGNFTAAQSQALDTAKIVSPGDAPNGPISPRIQLNTLIGAGVGFVTGTGVALLLEFLDQTMRSDEDVRVRLGMTTLAVVPVHSPDQTNSRPGQRAAEAYRRLRTNLQFCAVEGEFKSLVVTSACKGEGKSLTSAKLAVAVAASGQRVLLVDADMRRPRQHEIFGRPQAEGLSEMLLQAAKGTKLSSNAQSVADVKNLSLLTAGTTPPNPAELLASRHAAGVMRFLEGQYELVIVDAPPSGQVSDALSVAAMASATLMVVRAKSTSARQASAALEELRRVGANLVGIVLNRVSDEGAYYYYTPGP